MKLSYKNEPQVIKALSLAKWEKIKAFEILRKNGVYLYNKSEIEKENPIFICERVQHLTDDASRILLKTSTHQDTR